MTRRQKILLLAGCGLVAVVAVCFFCVGEREPSYNGRTLSEWLGELTPGGAEKSPLIDHGPEAVEDAVRHIGTNAIPFLEKWSRANDARRQWLANVGFEIVTNPNYHLYNSIVALTNNVPPRQIEPEFLTNKAPIDK